MKNIATIADVKSILVNVSEKIEDKNILSFAKTSLDLNNIEYSDSHCIYCTFLKYSNQYQIIVFLSTFKYIIFELIYSSTDTQETGTFTLYITKDFFVIFNNNRLYTYQNINQQYTKKELLEYISKNFKITINSVKELDENILNDIAERKDFDLGISFLKDINQKSNKSFLLYIFYLIICISSTIIYINYEEEAFNKKKQLEQEEAKNKYLKNARLLKFIPYETEYTRLIKIINTLELELISYRYISGIMNIKISSKEKNNIYLFLNHYQKSLLGNSISKPSSENIFVSVVNVKINRK